MSENDVASKSSAVIFCRLSATLMVQERIRAIAKGSDDGRTSISSDDDAQARKAHLNRSPLVNKRTVDEIERIVIEWMPPSERTDDCH